MKKIVFLLSAIIISTCVKAAGPELTVPNIDREQQQLEWCFTYSNLLGYNITYISNPRLYQLVGEWLGTPYKYSGDTKKGVDCSGLICGLYRDCYNKALAGSARDIFKEAEPL